MIPLLQENCEKAGVKMMLDTTATEILTDANGAAVGVKATGASGKTCLLYTSCTAEGKDETQGVGSEAIAKMPGEIAESGSIAVDGVSGATVTSTAIKEAAAAALTAAGLNPDDYKTAVENLSLIHILLAA